MLAFLIDSILDFLFSVIGSDVVYSEGAVVDLLETLMQLSGPNTTIFLAGELRNGKEYHSFFFLLGAQFIAYCSVVFSDFRCHS